jgi:hypothetical protein
MSVVQFPRSGQQPQFICSACGAERGCNCNAPAVEKLAQKQEQDRQRAKAYRERKAEEDQRPRHVTGSGSPGFDAACERAKRLGLEVRRFDQGYQLSDPDYGNGPAYFTGLGKLNQQLKEIAVNLEERDRKECVALHQKTVDAKRELDQWIADHPAVNPAIAALNATIAALNTLTDEQRVEFDRHVAGLKKPKQLAKALAAISDPTKTLTAVLVTKAINLLPVDIFIKGFNDAADLNTRLDEANAAEKLKTSTFSQATLIQNGNASPANAEAPAA